MQTGSIKIKALLLGCVIAILILLATSIFLTIKIHSAKKELQAQKDQIGKLEETIKDYENIPSGDNYEIVS